MQIKIQNITISKDTEPLVVPEIGINHNGSLEIAKLMVDSAKRAGAKIVKTFAYSLKIYLIVNFNI